MYTPYRLSGLGKLLPQSRPVEYELRGDQHVADAGFAITPKHIRNLKVKVAALDGQTVRDGEYTLVLEDGSSLRLVRSFKKWHFLGAL